MVMLSQYLLSECADEQLKGWSAEKGIVEALYVPRKIKRTSALVWFLTSPYSKS